MIRQSRHLTRGDEHSRLSMLIRALSFWILVSSFIEIGCFKKPNSGLKEVLASHFKDFHPAKAKSKAYVKECSELASQKGYKYFALGDKGSCLSSATANNEYHLKGGTGPKDCKDGIGSKSTVDVYTFGELKSNVDCNQRCLWKYFAATLFPSCFSWV